MDRADARSPRSSAARSRPPPTPRCKLLVWAKLRGTKDQGIEFSAVPTEVAALKEKLGGDGLEVALLDRSLVGQPIAYRVPTADELGL